MSHMGYDKKCFKNSVQCLCMLGPAYPVGHTSSKHLLHTFKKCAAHGRSPSNDYFLASCKVSLYDRCMDLLVVEKSSQLIFISRFPQKFLRPLTPDFNVGISKHENIFFLPGGGVRPEKSSQPKSMLRSSNIEIWGSGGIIGCRSVCFNSINGVRPHSQSRRLRTFFLLLSGGSVYM